MKILLTLPNTGLGTSDFLRSGNIVHDPSLDSAPTEDVLAALDRYGAAALVTSRPPDEAALRRRTEARGPVFLACVPGAAPGRGGDLEAVATALARCERHFALSRPLTGAAPPPASGEGSREVVLIGAGVVNLVTALYLTEAGYRVTVLDRSPAPGSAAWEAYGCTHAGDDARMFTFTEMDSYNNQDFHGSPPDWFRRPVEENGWLARDAWTLSPEEHAWIDEFERVPSWLARSYNDDIFALTAEAGREWELLRRRRPGLFENVVLADDILRVYEDPAHLESALARHRAIGAVLRELPPVEAARDCAALAGPIRNGSLAGGFFVPGFTLNVHKFTDRAVAWLTDRGVRFHWNSAVPGVRRDDSGALTGLDCPVPLPRDAHVVASPGVYGSELLRGTPCEGRIHGVLGGWIRISNRATGLRNSLKVGRRGHVTEDANVTVGLDADGQEILIIGSGYGYTGTSTKPDERQLAAVRHGIADTIERLFPDRAGLRASSRGGDNYAFKYCIRPWTATSLGLYHAEEGPGRGLYVINGGHNTGGFAQAPAIARAVLATLRGEEHPMHRLYHPERFTAFTAPAACTRLPAARAPRPLASRT
ncbi:FAD-dependent oxidoreductase [Streptomyces roseoverticillatus]|uniref:NAD(P)/FAD-dependent oxidoreductase n=1 Tax=Streptomyces roseoverticillatus TaxID=66429 RepID=UPI001F24D631|nr:FAD-binding oxidoreductase [Streptomyces roseoverticillatus]MCF3102081.1 FAD-dependent oxidoreductase [Streptomyces roseoverticillatus]